MFVVLAGLNLFVLGWFCGVVVVVLLSFLMKDVCLTYVGLLESVSRCTGRKATVLPLAFLAGMVVGR